MSTAPVSACPTCGGRIRLGEGHGPYRNFCSGDCIRVGGSTAPYTPRRTPLGPIPGVDPLAMHYGDHGTTTPLISISDWPLGVGDLVVDCHGREGQVVSCRWATKHSGGEAIWESCVEVIPGRVGATSLGRGRHAQAMTYRVTDLEIVTRWEDLDG